MGNRSSRESLSAVYRAARNGDSTHLGTLISQARDDHHRRRLIEWTDLKGRTPLIIASQKGHLGCVLELLNHSADVHHISKRDFGGTALHEAVYYKWRGNGIVEALLRHGANPFVKNAHDRSVLQLALIENAAKDLFIPWLVMFDRYGYFAEELLVREFTGEQTVWRTRWVTIVPMYSTSDPRYRRCLGKVLMIYNDSLTRTLLSSIDLTDAVAADENMIAFVKLGASCCQPSGMAATKLDNGSWVIALKSPNECQSVRLGFIAAINHETETIIERQLNRHRIQVAEDEAVPGSNASYAGVPQLPENSGQVDHPFRSGDASNMIADADAVAGEEGPVGYDINDDVCVICLDGPQDAGFVHGDSQHVCACRSCAYLVYLSERSRCPICRESIDSIAIVARKENEGHTQHC